MTTAPQTAWDAETNFVHTQLLALVASQSRTVLFGVMAASMVLMAIAVEWSALGWWVAWVALVLAGQAVRIKVQKPAHVSADTAAVRDSVRWGTYVAALCGGIQALCLLGFPSASDTNRALITLIILGLVTGAISNSAGHPKTYLAYCVPLIVPLSLLWGVCTGQQYSAMTGVSVGALILFCSSAILAGYAKTAWQLFEDSCRIRFRESDLNARLVHALAVAEQASRAKTRFLAAASHDLRQPLHAIGLISAALKLRQLDARSDEMVTLLNQVSTSLSAQLDSLLDISKLDAGVVEVTAQTLSVPQLMGQFFAEFSPLAYAKGLTPVLDLQTQASMHTDPVLLLRLLGNLSQNALKFTTQGSITLRAFEVNGELVLAVADTGCGISGDHHEEIFQEFYQVSNNERDPVNGLGLGLSIVRRLATLLGIRLVLRSALDQGTTVLLHLPLHHTMAAPNREAEPASAQYTAVRFDLTVLVIDDEMSVRKATALLLTELGCTCLLADSLETARQSIATVRPDLIMADLRLRNHENGIDAIAALRAELGDVAALLISGDTAPERLQLASQVGLRLCHKPLSVALLTHELRQIPPRKKP